MGIVLASRSPRRIELLTAHGVVFTVDPADIDESVHAGENPHDYVGRMSMSKHAVVAARHARDTVVAADTIVADGADRVRTEADLFRYSAATLEWLASASGAAAIGRSGGEATARQIAAAMERLRQRPAARTRLALLASRARNGLRWMRHGD